MLVAWFTLVLTRLLSCLRPSQVHGIPFPNSPKSFPVLAKDPALRLSKDPALSPSNHIPMAAETQHHPRLRPLPATPFTQASRARHPSESVATPRPRPLHPPKRQFTLVHIAPQTRQKSAPLQLKSFLEKTLTARETPTSTPPIAHPSSTVPNPAHLAAATGDNRMADPLPRRTR